MIPGTGKHGATSRPVNTARHSAGPPIPAPGRGGPPLDARMKVGPDAGGSIPEEIAAAGDAPEGALWGGGKHRLPHRGRSGIADQGAEYFRELEGSIGPGPRGTAHE